MWIMWTCFRKGYRKIWIALNLCVCLYTLFCALLWVWWLNLYTILFYSLLNLNNKCILKRTREKWVYEEVFLMPHNSIFLIHIFFKHDMNFIRFLFSFVLVFMIWTSKKCEIVFPTAIYTYLCTYYCYYGDRM